MKRLVLLFILASAFTISGMAQDKTADLKKLLEVMKSEKMIDAMVSNMIPIMKQQVNGKIQGDDAQEKFDEFVDFMMEEVKVLSNKLVNEEMVGIYDKYFTHEEIIDLIVFYESPTGKKILEKTPMISADMMNSMSKKYMPEFQERLRGKIEELK